MLKNIHDSIDTFSPRHAEGAKQVLHRLGEGDEIVTAALTLRNYYRDDTNCGHQDFPNPFNVDSTDHIDWHEAYTSKEKIEPVEEPTFNVEAPKLEDMTKDQLEQFARDNLDMELDKRLKKPELISQVEEALEKQSQE